MMYQIGDNRGRARASWWLLVLALGLSALLFPVALVSIMLRRRTVLR